MHKTKIVLLSDDEPTPGSQHADYLVSFEEPHCATLPVPAGVQVSREQGRTAIRAWEAGREFDHMIRHIPGHYDYFVPA